MHDRAGANHESQKLVAARSFGMNLGLIYTAGGTFDASSGLRSSLSERLNLATTASPI